MQLKDWRNFIKKSRISYMKIGDIKCPAFLYERVYFNRQGFNHLLRKGADLRNRSEQKERISLLSDAVRVIASSNKFSQYRESILDIDGVISKAYFWSITNNSVIVIIRQINNGKKYFFSVIPNKKTKTPEGV